MFYQDNIRPFLEGVYFLSGVALLIGVWFASRQLETVKEQFRTASVRSAKEKAIEASVRFSEILVPKIFLEMNLRRELEIRHDRVRIGDFHPNEIKGKPKSLENPSLSDAILSVMNEMDAIAAYFVTEVADEETGFSIFGLSYCQAVEEHYAYLAFNRNGKSIDYLDHLVKLYKLWRPRLTESDLKEEVGALQAKLASLEALRADKASGRSKKPQ